MPARLKCLSALLLAAATPGLATASEGFPYQAVVSAPAATVYSGPGPHYYDTAELPSGETVQVFEETPGGFAAIRPPAGSFSWTPKSAVRMIDDQIGEVTRDQSPARVGSLLHDRRDAVHVRLDVGERVRVLGEQVIDGVGWLQIAPPSGEFRWVRLADLRRGGPAAADDSPTGGGWVQAAAHTASSPVPPGAPTAETIGVRALPTANADPTAPPKPLTSAQASGGGVDLGDPGFQRRLSSLDVAVSRQVAERPTLWRFDEIEQHAARLLTEAQTDAQRQAVRDLATRVDRFAAIANRYKQSRGVAPAVGLTKATVPGATPPRIEPLAAGVAPVSGYDAVGVLRPVVSKRPNAPQYALVDQTGKIITFVTANPQLNLTALVGQRVGVQGVKGFMPEYQQSHVTAQRVASLQTTTR